MATDRSVPGPDFRGHQADGRLYGAGIQSRADLYGSGDAADRASDLPDDRRRRESRDALDGIRLLHVAVQRGVHAAAVPDAARAGTSSLQSTEVRWGNARAFGIQYGSVVYHQYQLAGLFG